MQESFEHNEILPLNRRSRSLSQQFYMAMKKPPKMLIKLSSTYFQPLDTNQVATHSRAQSLNIPNDGLAANTNPAVIKKRTTSEIPTVRKSHRSWDIKNCAMCCDKICDAVFMDCGHGGVCFNCAVQLRKSHGKCHLCREVILQVLRVKEENSEIMEVISFENETCRSDYLEEIQEEV